MNFYPPVFAHVEAMPADYTLTITTSPVYGYGFIDQDGWHDFVVGSERDEIVVEYHNGVRVNDGMHT